MFPLPLLMRMHNLSAETRMLVSIRKQLAQVFGDVVTANGGV